ncbi:MAG: hypothetical protein ACFE8U_14850, partial [Candidatus Hermodarchaeota archaeon]
PGLFKSSSFTKSVFFPPLEEEPSDLIHTNDGGFAFILSSYSTNIYPINRRIILVKTNEFGVVQWSHQLKVDYLFHNPTLIPTIDGGFAFAYSHYENVVLAKMDFNGKMEWNQSYCFRVPPRNWNDIKLITTTQTVDGGFVLLVRDYAQSLPSSNYKQLIIKTDNSGTIQWQKIFESKNDGDYPDITDVINTFDKGYILIGLDTHTTDIWLMKIDEYSNSVWNKSFQLVQDQWIQEYHIIQTSDRGFAITAELNEYLEGTDEPVQSWLIKTNSSGDLEWKKLLQLATITAPIQTSENNFVIAGTVNTGQENTPYDKYDIGLVNVDHLGNLLWKRTFGDMEKNDVVYCLVQTFDEEFAIAVHSNGTASLIKLSAEGEVQWSQRYDAEITDIDWTNALTETSDKGFALAGITTSYGTGPTDMWLVKTDKYGFEEYNQTFGGDGDEVANAIIQTKNGDFVLVGSTTSYGNGQSDIWLLKTDREGLLKWNRTYGTEGKEMGYYVEETIDGGLAVMGISYSNDTGSGEVLLIKTDDSGGMLWNKTYAIPIIDPGIHEWSSVCDQTSYYLYGKSTITRIISFIETNDGGFAIFFPNHLLKTDRKGVVKWNTTIITGIDFTEQKYWNITVESIIMEQTRALSHNRVCFKETSDNGFIIGITKQNPGWYGGMICLAYDGELVKIDAEGVIQWTKKWDHTYPECYNTIEAVYTEDDGIISWIWFVEGDYLNISKIGLDGTWYWNKTVSGDWYGKEYHTWDLFVRWSNPRAFDSILTSTGEYVITGIGWMNGHYSCSSPDAWLAKRDTTGVVLWKRTYGTTGGSIVINTSFTYSPTSTSDQNTFSTIANSEQESYNDQNREMYEPIPLLAGVIIPKWCSKRKKREKPS